MTWWERWGWINTNNHPNNKGNKLQESTNYSKWRFCVAIPYSQLSKSVLDNRCMKLLEVVSTLKRVWPSSSMAQLQIDASDTPGEIRGKFQVFIYWSTDFLQRNSVSISYEFLGDDNSRWKVEFLGLLPSVAWSIMQSAWCVAPSALG